MEQTFNDRYIEIREAQKGLFGFMIWTFADTTIGIFREHLMTQISRTRLEICVIKSSMKKLLLGCLILITACQGGASTLTAEPSSTATIQTPPEPATATLTFTPSPTLTSTPSPKYFTEEFNTEMSAWVSFQTGGETNPTLTLEDDILRLDIPSPYTWYYAVYDSHEYQNVSISTKFTGTPSGSIGLICRYSESGWYEFNVASDGTYSLLLAQRLSQEIAQYTPIATDSISYLQPGNLNYEIGLTCEENNLLLYINGILLRNKDITNYGLSGGKVGITAASFDQIPMTASFEWVKVSE